MRPRRVSLLRVVALLVVAASEAHVEAQRHPFGARPMRYATGAAVPGHRSAEALAAATRDFYDAWKARYLREACGAGRWVVEARTRAGNLTVSEAHGYGMLIVALMAGHERDARTIFDGMVRYLAEHRSAITPGLMAWYQTTACESDRGRHSATDGDLDIAYALLLADRQWGSDGEIDYRAEARAVLAAVERGVVDGSRSFLRLGDWTRPEEPRFHDATRSSDFMPGHLRSFAIATGSPVWNTIRDRTYALFEHMQATYAPTTGLLPDFIVAPLDAARPADPDFLEGPHDGAYYFNACRVPWRVATDFLVSGEPRAHRIVQRITGWIRTASGGDPARVRAGYRLDGRPTPGANRPSAAFVAPLGVAAMVDAANQSWLDAIWDHLVAAPPDDGGYYENTLRLLAMLVMSGNWWAPEAVAVSRPALPAAEGAGHPRVAAGLPTGHAEGEADVALVQLRITAPGAAMEGRGTTLRRG